MKIKLHRPNRDWWLVAMVLFILGLLGFFDVVPVLNEFAFYLAALSAALLLLCTWIF